MKYLCQIRSDGTIAQCSVGHAPFENPVEIPAEIANQVVANPECYIFNSGVFQRVREPEARQSISLEQRITEKELEIDFLRQQLTRTNADLQGFMDFYFSQP